MKQWINSPEHNKNLLAQDLTHSGNSVYVIGRDNLIFYYGAQLNVNEDSPNELFRKILKRTEDEEKKTSQLE